MLWAILQSKYQQLFIDLWQISLSSTSTLKRKKHKHPQHPQHEYEKSLKWFQVNYFYPLSLFLPPLPSLRWKVWIFMSRLDTLIRWIMLHASWRRHRLSAWLITPSVSRSECSVTAAADNCVATRPGRVTGQWGERLTGWAPSDLPSNRKYRPLCVVLVMTLQCNFPSEDWTEKNKKQQQKKKKKKCFPLPWKSS